VSINSNFWPLRQTDTEIASRVVPGRSKAPALFSSQVLISVDFPTFGAGHRQPDDAGLAALFSSCGSGRFRDSSASSNQIARALSMRSRDRVNLTQPQLEELAQAGAVLHSLGFVGPPECRAFPDAAGTWQCHGPGR